MSASFNQEGIYTPDHLIAGGDDIQGRKVTLLAGAGVLKRGAVLGKISASGKYVLSKASAADGSQHADAILAESISVGASDSEGIVYISGTFSAAALTLGEGHNLSSIDDDLRQRGLFIVGTIAA